jgi:NAD+ diphosphatase
VFEESGVVVGDVQYAGSQPWPFPSSLMLGFFAYADTTELVLEDPEITEAAWFSRTELLAALNAGELLLPPPVSIARKLIESWYGEPLPQQ